MLIVQRNPIFAGLILFVLLGSVGCSSSNEGKIEGTQWRSVTSTMRDKPLPAGSMALAFHDDGTLEYTAGPETYRGTYVLGSWNYVTFKFEEKLANRFTHKEKVLINDDGDLLTLIDSDGTTLKFSKE